MSAAANLLPSLRCLPGFALDLSTLDENGKPWDFDIAENRERAKRLVLEQKPGLLIGTQLCTAFSAWQRINNQRRDPDLVCEEYRRAMVHLSFCGELYNLQLKGGRYFLHEHLQIADRGLRALCDNCLRLRELTRWWLTSVNSERAMTRAGRSRSPRAS